MKHLLERLIEEDFGICETAGRFSRAVDHDSLVYDRLHNRFYWNSAGISGTAFDYLVGVRHMNASDAKELLKDNTVLPEFAPILSGRFNPSRKKVVPLLDLVSVFYENGKKHREYWYEKRGYTDETVNKFKLGYFDGWYCIPIFVDGEFKNFQMRMENPKRIKQWYKHMGILPFNFSILTMTNWVVIAEAIVDAIMLRQNNIPAVSQTSGSGGWNPKWNIHFAKQKRIFVVYDNDSAGMSALRVARNWGYKAKIYNFWNFPDKYDITDFFKDGHTKDEFMDLLENESVFYDTLEGRRV
jgi:hypothetical protein